ncbi:MAG: sulfurtransferase complex subunit TusC [Nitrospinae bacterium]|nr:sulfurtransferase complex subunit TusC [Nitrospinota bacterium]
MDDMKKIMFLMRQAPHGGIYSYEGLETILIFAAFEQDLSMVFVGDGVFALVKGQDTTGIGIKGYIKTYGVLEDYGVEHMYVDKASMEARGLTTDDFAVPVEVVDAATISALMEEQHAVIPY